MSAINTAALSSPIDHRPSWGVRHQTWLAALDASVLLCAVLIALTARFPQQDGELRGVPYLLVGALLGLSWWGALALTRTYELRFLGDGPEEFRRVGAASLRVAAVLGVVCYLGALPLSRGFVAVLLGVGTAGLLAGRVGGRAVLHHQRARGRWQHRVVAVGSTASVAELITAVDRHPRSGLNVVAACVPGAHGSLPLNDVCGLTAAPAVVHRTRADTLAVTGGPGMTSAALRELTYAVEGSRVDLLVAPSLLPSNGVTSSLTSVGGLPLLELAYAELPFTSRALKGAFDRVAAVVLLVVLAPVLVLGMLAVRITSRGPVLTRERWLGRDAQPFTGYRLRTRSAPAEAPAAEDEQRAPKRRLTPVGGVLERTLLNDLPQLVNVLLGQMSFVGPRPLPVGLRAADALAVRHLHVKPGLTGIAQVGHRRSIGADEAVQLDVHYVDQWSFGLDLVLLAKTVVLLLTGRRLT